MVVAIGTLDSLGARLNAACPYVSIGEIQRSGNPRPCTIGRFCMPSIATVSTSFPPWLIAPSAFCREPELPQIAGQDNHSEKVLNCHGLAVFRSIEAAERNDK